MKFKAKKLEVKKLYNGNLLKNFDFEQSEDNSYTFLEMAAISDGTECLVYDKEGCFTAIYKYHVGLRAWKAEKMFL